MADFRVQPETVVAYFNGLARRDMFDEVIVIGRFKPGADAEERDVGYEYYVAASGPTETVIQMIKDATSEWDLD